MNKISALQAAYEVTCLQSDIHPHGVTGNVEHDRRPCEGGAMWREGARTGVLFFNAANVALCQHQHPTNVLNATIPGGGQGSAILEPLWRYNTNS